MWDVANMALNGRANGCKVLMVHMRHSACDWQPPNRHPDHSAREDAVNSPNHKNTLAHIQPTGVHMGVSKKQGPYYGSQIVVLL